MPDNRRLLEYALKGLQVERERIEEAIADIERQLRTSSSPAGKAAQPVNRRRRGGITPAGRKRLSEAMKKRWEERRKLMKAKGR